MPTPHDVVVLIPSLHPNHLLPAYVDDLVRSGFHRILIVDDGSGPDYQDLFAETARMEGCTVIGYAVNRGKGHALKHGMAYIAEHYRDAPGVVTADSDGQHTAEDVLKVASLLVENTESGLILGSRDFSQHNVPFKSRAGNRLTTFFFALLYGTWLPDTQTGLRGFSAQMIPFLRSVPGDRFEYEMNMLIYCSNEHIPFRIVPIHTIYIEENKGTHFRPFHDSMRIYRQLFGNFIRFASSGFVSTGIDLLLFTLLDKWALPPLLSNPGQPVLWGISLQVLVATAIARISSGLVNYKLNRTLVFKIEQSRGSLARYAALFTGVLITSATLVSFLHSWTGVDRTLIKIIVDTTIFFFNYRIQKAWVFKRNELEAVKP
ncbi:MAG: GtrA family protein [Christensenellales bacterium]|jgi:putative flippase GtrA